MGGYRVSLDIARGALSASQNSLAIAGHNIANVSTPGFSRQSALLDTRAPVNIGSFQYGSGVIVSEVTREINVLLEERLLTQKSLLAASEEGVLYLDNLESLFNIQSENNLDGQLSDFWNTWHDLSNNPDGAAERKVVYENGIQLAVQMNNLNADITQLETHIDQELENGVYQVNNILSQIAALNSEINNVEAAMPANDQRDARERLVTELSEFMSINTIDQQVQKGFLTILTDTGFPLVIGAETYPLDISDGRVEWTTSGGGKVDISDAIKSGKISGWLDVKEEVIQKAKNELDVLTKELIWGINSLHSQGVGQTYYSSALTGTYAPAHNGLLSTLDFGNKIDYTKDFKMWVRDNQSPVNATSIEIDMAKSDTTFTFAGAGASAGYTYNFTVTTEGTVGPGSDDPVVTWEKVDPSTGVVTAGAAVTVTDAGVALAVDGTMTFELDAGYLTAGNTYSINTSAANVPIPLDVTHDPTTRAGSVLDTYVFNVDSGGGDVTAVSTANPMVVNWASSYSSGTFTLDDPTPPINVDVDGMALTFNSGILFKDEAFVINTNDTGYPIDSNGAFAIETSSTWHWTVDSFKDQFNSHAVTAGVGSVSAGTTIFGELEFTPINGYSFAFSDSQADDSGLMAALGVNTFFTGYDTNTISVNSAMEDIQKIAAARIEGGDSNGMISDQTITDPATVSLVINAASTNNTITFEENGTILTATIPDATYTTTNDLNSLAAVIQAQMDVVSGLGAGTYKVEYDDINNQFSVSENDGSDLTSLKVFWDLTPNTASALGFKDIENTYLPPNGDYGISNNENALALSDVQYAKTSVAQWTYSRGSLGTSETVSAYTEEYYQTIISSIGISSSIFHQSEEFGGIMVEKLTEQRDSISGVSIDEEMIDLMRFQQAYTAAAKLITTVDEMLTTVLGLK